MARIAPADAVRDPIPYPSGFSATVSRPAGRLELRAWKTLDNAEQIGRWSALAQCAAQPNPFYEQWFLLPSLRTLDPRGKVEVLCLEVEGQLAGLMPIRRQNSYYGYPLPHLRNWVHDNCFCGQPLVAAGMEALFWREVLAWCDANTSASLFLHLMHMPGQGVLHEALKLLLSSQHRPAATVMEEERAMLSSELSPEDYLSQSLNQKKRKELRRQRRRLAEEGSLEVVRCSDDAAIGEWVQQFLTLEQAGWKGLSGSAMKSSAANAALFKGVLTGAAQAGRLERLSLELNGKPIAMLATFLTAPGAFSFKTAFDEDYARFSPGVLLQIENLSVLNDETIGWVDSCAVQDHKMIDHIWRERRRMTRHSLAIGGKWRRNMFRQLARKETGQPAGNIR